DIINTKIAVTVSFLETKMKNLVYEDTPRYDFWLKLVLGGILALTLVLGIILLFNDVEAAWVMFGVTLFESLPVSHKLFFTLKAPF
nr:hypothetical protein [Chlamydiota bacterium]